MERRIDLIKEGRGCLEQRDIPNAGGEAEWLAGHVLNCSRLELYLDNQPVPARDVFLFRDLLEKRITGVPLQYLLGCAEFMGLKIKTAVNVFIPRPETEILAEAAVNAAASMGARQYAVLDIGTGSGNIAVSLAGKLANAAVFACDICDFALQLTKENVLSHNARVTVVKSDLFSAFAKKEQFDLVVSNPPYIKTADISGLPVEVRQEPKSALDGGSDGVSYYRRIIADAPEYMREGALLCLEMGDNQWTAARDMLERDRRWAFVNIVKDNNNKERVIIARKIKEQDNRV